MTELSIANMFTVLLGVFAFTSTHIILNWIETPEKERAEAGCVIPLSLAALELIVVFFLIAQGDLRVLAVLGAAFLCCIIHEGLDIVRERREQRADPA